MRGVRIVLWTGQPSCCDCRELLLRAIVSSICNQQLCKIHPPPTKLCNQPSRNIVSASSVVSFNNMPKTKVVFLLNFYFHANIRSSLCAEALTSMFCFGADTLRTAFKFPQICPNGKDIKKANSSRTPNFYAFPKTSLWVAEDHMDAGSP